jgi:hypothetical protein
MSMRVVAVLTSAFNLYIRVLLAVTRSLLSEFCYAISVTRLLLLSSESSESPVTTVITLLSAASAVSNL